LGGREGWGRFNFNISNQARVWIWKEGINFNQGFNFWEIFLGTSFLKGFFGKERGGFKERVFTGNLGGGLFRGDKGLRGLTGKFPLERGQGFGNPI